MSRYCRGKCLAICHAASMIALWMEIRDISRSVGRNLSRCCLTP